MGAVSWSCVEPRPPARPSHRRAGEPGWSPSARGGRRLHPVSTRGSMTGPRRASYACRVPDHAPAASPAPPLHRRLVAAVADDRRPARSAALPARAGGAALVAALVGRLAVDHRGHRHLRRVLLLACAGWLAWTLLPRADGARPGGTRAGAPIAGAALMVPARGAHRHRGRLRRDLRVDGRLPAAAAAGRAWSAAPRWRCSQWRRGGRSHAAVFGLFGRRRRRSRGARPARAPAPRPSRRSCCSPRRSGRARSRREARCSRSACGSPRDVHDVLAHTLAGLAIQLEAAEALLTDADDRERALEVVRRSRGLVVEGIDETRRAVSALRGDERLAVAAAWPRWSTQCAAAGRRCVARGRPAMPRRIAPDAELAPVPDRPRGAHQRRRTPPASPVEVAPGDRPTRRRADVRERRRARRVAGAGGYGSPAWRARGAGRRRADGRQRRRVLHGPGDGARMSERATARDRGRRPDGRPRGARDPARPGRRDRGGRRRRRRRARPARSCAEHDPGRRAARPADARRRRRRGDPPDPGAAPAAPRSWS